MKKIHMKKIPLFIACILIGIFFVGCSVNDIISDALSSSLGSGGGGEHPILSENDPELVGDALPFTLKLLDILISSNIDTPPLLLTAGQSYIAYANIYLQGRALMLPSIEVELQESLNQRAKDFYLRGARYCLDALEQLHPGFNDALSNAEQRQELFAALTQEDVDYLYWASLGIFGAYSIDVFDFELGVRLNSAISMMDAAFNINPQHGNGAIHEFYITYYASLPESLGGGIDQARHHFREAVRLSNNSSVSAYTALATGVAIPAQNIAEFQQLLAQALEVDVDRDPNRRLQNIVRQREAQWYLANLERFFIDYEVQSNIDF